MLSFSFRSLLPVFVSLIAVTGIGRAAFAEPQILGVVATSAPIPMRCDGTECVAYLATFCLEPDRPQPDHGLAYLPAKPDHFRISTLNAEGRHLSVKTKIGFTAEYYYTAVKVTVPATDLKSGSDGNVYLSAVKGAALMPAPVPGDADFHDEDEIARALTSSRDLASAFFESGDADVEGALLVNRTLGNLPALGRVDVKTRLSAWDRAVNTSGKFSTEGLAKGRSVFKTCMTSVDLGVYFNMRSCLNKRNGELLGHQTVDFWQALKAGS